MKKLLAIFFLFLITITCSVKADMVNDMYYYTKGDTLSFGGAIDGIGNLSDTDYNIYLGFYDEKGMIGVGAIPMGAEEEKLNVTEQTINLSRIPGNVTAKLMFWGGADGFKYLTNALPIQQSIGIETGITLVDSTGTATDITDGEVRNTITVLDKNGYDEKETYFIDDSLSVGAPKRGTIVAITVKDGRVIAYKELFDKFTGPKSAFTFDQVVNHFGLPAGTNSNGSTENCWYRKSGIPSWDYSLLSTPNGCARVGFGIVVYRNGSEIIIANRTGNEPTLYDENGRELIYATETIQLDLADDVNVMIVDMNENDSWFSYRISYGASGSISATPTCREIEAYTSPDGSGMSVDVWNLTNVYSQAGNYVYFKTLDDEITDIVMCYPYDS